MSDTTTTPATVPLADLLDLARAVADMRKCQRAYFAARKQSPHVPADREYQAARRAEKRVDSMVEDALNRDRQAIPGME